MLFDSTIYFHGTYRPYQQRVLNNLESFLSNEKIHIVAAPGSGKTTLGLELIKKLDKPSLILVPSIAIREQWIERFSTSFLSNLEEKDNWISNNIRKKKPIICITYQALFSAYKKEKLNESDEMFDDEEQDFKEFNLFDSLKEYQISTICLDECHHLKSEWWKVLEILLKKITNSKVIALTATPPYDSNQQDWQKYINLCGPIDDEIFVPELIKDHNLCPHDDFIYFSYPTNQEEEEIMKHYASGIKFFHKYKNNSELLEIVLSNKIYNNPKEFKIAFCNNEAYYNAYISFLVENKVKLPFKTKIIAEYEPFNINHLEILLQYLLFEDEDSYVKCGKTQSIKKELAALQMVNNKKVSLLNNEKILKKTMLSLSKLDSIVQIVQHEYNNMEEKLKCLILTDYVKIKNKRNIGDLNKEVSSFGTIPIFEYMRRKNLNGIKLCCISGSTCILPKSCIKVLPETFNYSPLNDDHYIELVIQNNNRRLIVKEITKLFEKGFFNVLIGSKALLGEGWDSPCINTLIIASFIGSYVLSNQMRGRAIRINKSDLQKKSNIWHLVCLDPYDYHFSGDYYRLQKRFQTFIGVDVKNKSIESGINRLGIKRIPYNKIEADIANKNSFLRSKNREEMAKTWYECIDNAENISSLCKLTMIPKKRLKKEVSFFQALFGMLLGFTLWLYIYGFVINIYLSHKISAIVMGIIFSIITLLINFVSIRNFHHVCNPKMKLKAIGQAFLKSLVKCHLIESKNVKVYSTLKYKNYATIYLKNATTYEQNIFSECIIQFLSDINQPRYLLAKTKYFFQTEFYVVPDIFKKNRETVKILHKELQKYFGLIAIIFAKSESGKERVLKAHKLYYFKYRNVEIDTKNVLILNKKKKK